jgi:hypothetical protein
MFTIALSVAALSAAGLVAACQKGDSRAEVKATDPARPAGTAAAPDPARPADPVKPADPAPADPSKLVSPTAAPAAAPNPALEAKGIALMQQMAEIFYRGAKDCDKLSSELKAFLASNKATLRDMTGMLKRMTEQEQIAFEARNRATQEAIGNKMQPGVVACAKSPNFQAAMREFPSE